MESTGRGALLQATRKRRHDVGQVSSEPRFDLLSPPAHLFEGDFSGCTTSGRSYDVAQDGKSFVMTRQTVPGAGVSRVEIVQRWLDDVRRRIEG